MKFNRYLYMFLALCLVLCFFSCDGSGSSDRSGIVGPKYTSTPENRSGVSVGDLVLGNKNTCTADNYKNDPASYAEDGDVVGIVVYKGETGTVGITDKVYMVGLNQGTNLIWAPDATTGYTTEFATSQTAGEDNWAVIEATDAAGAADAVTNYPAFNFANTYNVSGYSSGWFLPSFKEIREIYNIKHYINEGIEAIGSGAKLPTDGYMCSSSQSTSDVECISRVALNNGGPSGFGDKKGSYIVRVVHTLD